jgi:hypothetical protein
MIKLDFHGSTHGHFLEYVANVYIMQTTPSKASIFRPPTYSAHAADKYYLADRIIECGHFSANKNKFLPDDIVIRIAIDPVDDDLFFIALSNLMYKAGDIGFERQMLSIPDAIRNNPAELRNNWYSKINQRKTFAAHYQNFSVINNPVFDFSFKAFFSFDTFAKELSNLSIFLNQIFVPDQVLFELWSKFIEVNQGWQSYTKCNQILHNIFANVDSNLSCTPLEEAWLNFNLSSICHLYDGHLFTNDVYPTNTQTIYSIIQEHNNTLRN